MKGACYIKTYGCQMNVYDSTHMAETLQKSGYDLVDTPDAANLVILNTCHIREKAAEKVYSELGRLKSLKQKNKDMIFGVAGCVAQAEGDAIIARAPYVDMVFGPQTLQNLPAMLAEVAQARAKGKNARIVRVDFLAEDKFASLRAMPKSPIAHTPTAFVTIQEGCDKFCTFCVVPYTRGSEVSRSAREIVAEVAALVEKNVVEITLLGQNVNAWQDRTTGQCLGGLLRDLAQIPQLERLRFTTSHPRDMDDDLIGAYADCPSLMPNLHLPVQAGSNRILKAMNRGHTVEDYLAIIKKCRAARSDIALSSDFIVGFPGETDADFDATMALVREVNYAQAYSFKYSARAGTPAAKDSEQICEVVKTARLKRLQSLLNAQQQTFNRAHIGCVLPVLFEKRGRRAGQMSGRSPYVQSVHADLPENVVGKILPIRIETAHANSLTGCLA